MGAVEHEDKEYAQQLHPIIFKKSLLFICTIVYLVHQIVYKVINEKIRK